MTPKGLPEAAIFHPQVKPGGGSEALLAWTAFVLRKLCRVTLVSNAPVDLEKLNLFYGPSLSSDEIRQVILPPPARFIGRFDALAGFRLGRWAKANRHRFDLMVSTYNVMDFGKAGLQFLVDVSFDDELRRAWHPSPSGWRSIFYLNSPLRRWYLSLAKNLSRQTQSGWLQNVTVANSRWLAGVFEKKYGLKTRVIYPPIPEVAKDRTWTERSAGFVVMARISPEKNLELAISIVKALRNRGFDLHLHILGRLDDRVYARDIFRLCRESQGVAVYEGLVFGEKKKDYLSNHRFGLSTCSQEAFGLSVAEMVRAGMIVWVPGGGGQIEIVNEPDLVFENERDATEKIARVLSDDNLRLKLSQRLKKQAQLFSADRFVRETKELFESFLAGNFNE